MSLNRYRLPQQVTPVVLFAYTRTETNCSVNSRDKFNFLETKSIYFLRQSICEMVKSPMEPLKDSIPVYSDITNIKILLYLK